jgi:pimeloyl-ACP methyl ester carboxylesterase
VWVVIGDLWVRRRTPSLAAAVALSGVLTLGLSTVPGAVAAPVTAVASAAVVVRGPAMDVTSAVERRRVDSVPTPKLRWYSCKGYAECATVRVPLDYDQPTGATTELAVVRIKARDQKRKIGSLFINDGGPGGSATEFALMAPAFWSDPVLDRFDVIGVDPRGIGSSDKVRCFRSALERNATLDPTRGFPQAFPYGRAEEAAYVKTAKAIGRACSTTGRPLTGAMSTAQVARDMDVMRRAVGDKKLTYWGVSYGSALGQYYANMFPDRVRAVAIDANVNPVDWVGTRATREKPQDDRARSADGAYKALRELLVRCDKAGGQRCAFAAGDPVENFDLITRRLKAKPLVTQDAEGNPVTITYAVFIDTVMGGLFDRAGGYNDIIELSTQLFVATEPPSARTAAKARAAARRAAALITASPTTVGPGRDFPHDPPTDGVEGYLGVACTDGQHPADAALFPAKAAAADRRAPYFGRQWTYASAACARSTWTVRDEDAYTGPWTKRTSGPVLVVGSFWDPATNYTQSVDVSRLLPNSRLLSSDNWGHGAYGTSDCVNRTTDTFLLTQALPRKGSVCRGDFQPFQSVNPAARAAPTQANLKAAVDAATKTTTSGKATGTSPKVLPPVANPWPRR